VLPDIPADLLALYDKLRADHSGVGAAALHQRRCEGCRMELTPTDIGRIRDAARHRPALRGVPTHPGPTPESGL
jgi:hypothetical protein